MSCTCGQRFRDAEDYRDHLPCGGTRAEQRARQDAERIAELEAALAAKTAPLAVDGVVTNDRIFAALGTPPHCDSRVVHAPLSCTYCDARPDWQALRLHWAINFTGETDPSKAPCPATATRSVERIHQWDGNRPTTPEPAPPRKSEHVYEPRGRVLYSLHHNHNAGLFKLSRHCDEHDPAAGGWGEAGEKIDVLCATTSREAAVAAARLLGVTTAIDWTLDGGGWNADEVPLDRSRP